MGTRGEARRLTTLSAATDLPVAAEESKNNGEESSSATNRLRVAGDRGERKSEEL
jgi:hypothetical protein